MLCGRRRLAVLSQHSHRRCAQARTRLEARPLEVGVARIRTPREAATVVRVELVVHRGMDVGSDPLVEHLRSLPAEQQTFVGDGGTPHTQGLAATREPLLILGRQALVADFGLAVAPALVVDAEGAVIAIPSGDRTLIELLDE